MKETNTAILVYFNVILLLYLAALLALRLLFRSFYSLLDSRSEFLAKVKFW